LRSAYTRPFAPTLPTHQRVPVLNSRFVEGAALGIHARASFQHAFRARIELAVHQQSGEHEGASLKRNRIAWTVASDLKGYDPFIYAGTLDGLFSALLDVLLTCARHLFADLKTSDTSTRSAMFARER